MWNPFKRNIGSQLAKRYTTAKVKPKPQKMTARSVKDPETDKLVQKWSARAVPFVAFTDIHQAKLVGRARATCFNNSYGKAGLRVLRQNIVGESGIRFQSQVVDAKTGELDTDVNNAIEEAWKDFSDRQNCDTAGRKNLHWMQILALNSLVTDGEFFFKKVRDGRYGLQLQLIDALRIPPFATNRYRLEKVDQTYKNGIIFDKKSDKPLYYALNRDNVNYYDMQPDRSTELIPASEMLHGFQQEAAGQARGVPLGQTASETLYMIAKYAEAALQNARVGATKVGFFTQQSDQPPATTPKLDENGDPVLDEDGNIILQSAMDGVKVDMTSGSATSLPPGVDFSAWSPEYPNNEYEAFMKVMLRQASVGFSIPYSDMSGDLSDVNYSSMRQGAIEIRANYRILQGLLVAYLMDPTFMEWLAAVLMSEMLTVNGKTLTIGMFPQLYKPIWTPKRWQWIDPRSEAIANQIAIKQGLKAPSQIIKEMGGDPEEVWKSIEQDIETMKGMGLPEEFVMGIFAQQHATVQDLVGEAYSNGVQDMSNQN